MRYKEDKKHKNNSNVLSEYTEKNHKTFHFIVRSMINLNRDNNTVENAWKEVIPLIDFVDDANVNNLL